MHNRQPVISVIIPTFNRRHVLPRALRSVVAQDIDVPVEVIVVDDGSVDGTSDDIGSEFPQVRYLVQENRGVSSARNVGIRAARGEWIALLDSDDAWLPDKLAVQLEALEAATEYRVCHTEEIWIRNGVRVNPMKKHKKVGGWIYERCLPLCCISPSSVMIHRSIWDDVGVFDETLPACEDYDLWLRICAREPVLFVDRALVQKYGGHDDQLSRQYWGMDRFRIQALENILATEVLSPAQRVLTLSMMIRKLEILINGAKKRENQQLLAEYEPRLVQAIQERES